MGLCVDNNLPGSEKMGIDKDQLITKRDKENE